MNRYAILSSDSGRHDATALSTRLSAWHDAMVAHERRLRSGVTSDFCDDDCPHAAARALWVEAVTTLGARAHELAFLRSHAQDARRLQSTTASARRAPASSADTVSSP